MSDNRCFLCLNPEVGLECPHGCGVVACGQNHLRVHLGGARNGEIATSRCRPFRIEISETFGRHFVASRDISPLEEILLDRVAVLGPATKTVPVCLECLKPSVSDDGETVRCSGCHFPMCKSHATSTETNTFHDINECNVFRDSNLGAGVVDLSEDSLVHCAVFLRRMWNVKKSDPELFSDLYFQMSGETDDIVESKNFLPDLTEILQKKFSSPDFTRADILRCMGIKRTNANTLDSIDLPGGVALFQTYPLMNHHCNCNTSCVVDPKTFNIRVIAQRQIKHGEQITTRYFGPWQGQPYRLATILQQWQFICQCTRCQDTTDLGTMFSAIKCKSPKCEGAENPGFLLPIKSQMLGTPWQCNTCSGRRGHSQVLQLLASIESKIFKWKQEKGLGLESINDLVQSLSSDLHPNHFLIFKLKKTSILMTPINNKLETNDLKIMIRFIIDVLALIEVLDPGVTVHRATFLKKLAMVRILLAQRLLAEDGENFKEEFDREMALAVNEFKKASVCIGS